MSGYFPYELKWRHHVAGVKKKLNCFSLTESYTNLNLCLVRTTLLQVLLIIYMD